MCFYVPSWLGTSVGASSSQGMYAFMHLYVLLWLYTSRCILSEDMCALMCFYVPLWLCTSRCFLSQDICALSAFVTLYGLVYPFHRSWVPNSFLFCPFCDSFLGSASYHSNCGCHITAVLLVTLLELVHPHYIMYALFTSFFFFVLQ